MEGNAGGDARQHILLVEDDEAVREVVAEMLDDAGFRVTLADSGETMRAQLDSAELFDAVVLDLELPGEEDGTHALFVAQLGLPLVIVSGTQEAIYDAEGRRLPILLKPLTRDELTAALLVAMALDQ
jgi:DNA-binding response OmpR family regulator